MNRFLQQILVLLRLKKPHARRMAFSTFATTDRGLVRAENQDHFLCLPNRMLFCVADGMGGGADGALASEWACQAIDAAVKDEETDLALREQAIATALADVNARIRAYAKEHSYKMMGTTVVGFVSEPASGVLARVFHVGDSRVYRYRYGRLDTLTRDHTVGNELGQAMAGSINGADQARVLQARSNPLTHILTRAVGTELRVRPEWKSIDIQRGDRFLFCSDGVHDMLDDAEIAEILSQSSTPRVAVARLEVAVRKAGAQDNYTILCAYATCRQAT